MLPELSIGAFMTILVMGAAMSLLIIMMRAEPVVTERSLRISDGREMMERLTRELRTTYRVDATGSTNLDFYAYIRPGASSSAVERHISYQCTAGACVRREADASEALPETGVEMVDGIANADVFTFAPSNLDPEVVRIKLAFDVPGRDRDVILDDGVNLRNATNFAD